MSSDTKAEKQEAQELPKGHNWPRIIRYLTEMIDSEESWKVETAKAVLALRERAAQAEHEVEHYRDRAHNAEGLASILSSVDELLDELDAPAGYVTTRIKALAARLSPAGLDPEGDRTDEGEPPDKRGKAFCNSLDKSHEILDRLKVGTQRLAVWQRIEKFGEMFDAALDEAGVSRGYSDVPSRIRQLGRDLKTALAEADRERERADSHYEIVEGFKGVIEGAQKALADAGFPNTPLSDGIRALRERAEKAERDAVGGWTAAHEVLTAATGEVPGPGLDGVVTGIKALADRVAAIEQERDDARDSEIKVLADASEAFLKRESARRALATAREELDGWRETAARLSSELAAARAAKPRLPEGYDITEIYRLALVGQGSEYEGTALMSRFLVELLYGDHVDPSAPPASTPQGQEAGEDEFPGEILTGGPEFREQAALALAVVILSAPNAKVDIDGPRVGQARMGTAVALADTLIACLGEARP